MSTTVNDAHAPSRTFLPMTSKDYSEYLKFAHKWHPQFVTTGIAQDMNFDDLPTPDVINVMTLWGITPDHGYWLINRTGAGICLADASHRCEKPQRYFPKMADAFQALEQEFEELRQAWLEEVGVPEEPLTADEVVLVIRQPQATLT